MTGVPVCYKMYYKDQAFPIPKEMRQSQGGFMHYTVSQVVPRRFSSASSHPGRGERVLDISASISMKVNSRKGLVFSRGVKQSRHSVVSCIKSEANGFSRVPTVVSHLESSSSDASERENLCKVSYTLEFNSSEKQLRLLDSYFGKLNNKVSIPSSTYLNNMEFFNISGQSSAEKGAGSEDGFVKSVDKSGKSEAEEELAYLDNYLAKVNEESKDNISSASDDESTKAAIYAIKGGLGSGVRKESTYTESKVKDGQGGPKNSSDEISSLYLTSIMVSINIAVYLFELASPIRNSDLELFSIPSLYGAKINDLILIGEWWRLVTPMFLHSGILHVWLGCWVLLTFGPQVCRAYGSFTFCLLYILGGLSGNLTSFLHTPDPTVGGTGPAFAIIGAWLVYQYQNRDVMGKDAFESMFQKAIAATALGFIISNFGPIDDWTHFGAAFTGTMYGLLTCPTLQMDDAASSNNGQEDGITLVRRYGSPCKSLAFFAIFILVLGSLLFIIEPPLNSTAADILL